MAGAVNFNPLDGKCYHAEDPLLGPNGTGGTVWTRLADMVLEGNHYNRVLIVPFGIGGSEIARWVPGGDLHVRVRESAEILEQAGIRPTHVVWHQGEADHSLGTSTETYRRRFGELVDSLRAYGIAAPIYPAIASLCRNRGGDDIRNAQRSLPEHFEGVLPGPDTDSLDRFMYRHDNCHFSEAGLEAHAALWLEALTLDQALVD